MNDKKQDSRQDLKSYVSDKDIAHSDNYFQSSPVEGVDDMDNASGVIRSQEPIKSTDDVSEEISQKYTQKEREEDSEEHENYKQNDPPDWYLKCVKFINQYSREVYDFCASTEHGITYSFLTSGLTTALTSAIWANVTTKGSPGELTKVFHIPVISIVALTTVPLINYVMTRLAYMFTRSYMRPIPSACTRDTKGGVFSIINGLFMFILVPLRFIGSVIECLIGILVYSATFLDLYLEKDSFKVGLESFIARVIIRTVMFILEILLVTLIGLLIYNSFSNIFR